MDDLTIIIPVKNEAKGLDGVLRSAQEYAVKVIVIDDGSDDSSGDVARSYGAKVIRHGYSKGNGAAIKSGICAATTDYIGMMDGDGQHSVDELIRLYEIAKKNKKDLVVGCREREGQAGIGRALANTFYNKLASWMVGREVKDLTSGQRVFRRRAVEAMVWALPNGFSYPTTSTILFYRLGHEVEYEPVKVAQRIGESHISPLKDGFRFLLIITKIGTLYSPFKLFLPMSLVFFGLGLARYLYTYSTEGYFTNMSALLMVSSVIVFLMGVLSEQVALLVVGRIASNEK